jgi:hypothetical protein
MGRSGLGDETYIPPWLYSNPPHYDMEHARKVCGRFGGGWARWWVSGCPMRPASRVLKRAGTRHEAMHIWVGRWRARPGRLV